MRAEGAAEGVSVLHSHWQHKSLQITVPDFLTQLIHGLKVSGSKSLLSLTLSVIRVDASCDERRVHTQQVMTPEQELEGII